MNVNRLSLTIRKLPDECINKIAAGEIVHRPLNAIKELLENSLDARATNVRIIIQRGGLDRIELQDNGHGIPKFNAKLVCQRHSTSKLQTTEDLTRIMTFGFRGEALSAINEVALVKIRSFCPESDDVGWEGEFIEGKLVSISVKSNAAKGTCIIVTDIFKGIDTRRQAHKRNVVEEKRIIMDVIARYALNNCETLSINLLDHGGQDLVSNLAPSSTKATIGSLFGYEYDKNALEMTMKESKPINIDAKIVFSYAKTTSQKPAIFILFVNNRLVECPEMKRELLAVCQSYFSTKHFTLLLYISLTVLPKDLDVNVHPSKNTVTLHFQEQITDLIMKMMTAKFEEHLNSIALKVNQSVSQQKSVMNALSSPSVAKYNNGNNPGTSKDSSFRPAASFLSQSSTPKRPFQQVHVDANERRLEHCSEEKKESKKRVRRKVCIYNLDEIRKNLAGSVSHVLKDLLRKSVFIGVFDRDFALIQKQTKLYAMNLRFFAAQLFYQYFLYDFANFPPIDIKPPGNKLTVFLDAYFEDINKHEPKLSKKMKYADPQSVIDKLYEHKTIFEDFFCFKIDKEFIYTLPCLLTDHVPNLVYLGKFLCYMANKVDYTQEIHFYNSVAKVFGNFYAHPPSNLKDPEISAAYHTFVEDKLYYEIKVHLEPPESLNEKKYISYVTDTIDLYKVFERC